jgi:hypothetical protein
MQNWIVLCLFLAAAALPSDNQMEALPVRCDYETRMNNGSVHNAVDAWTFIRSENCIAHTRANRSDIWTRMGKQVGFEQAFHDQKLLIEYAPGDVRPEHGAKNWRALAEIIDPSLLSKLKRKGSRKIAGHHTERFVGDIEGVEWEICWIPELRLPAKIVTRKGNTISETVLKEVRHEAGPAIIFPEYRRADYADLGDMESDPAIQTILRNENRMLHQH